MKVCHLPTYEAKWKILLHNFFFRLSDFFLSTEGFCIKKCCRIWPFSRKNREPEWPFFSDLGERKLNSGLAPKLNVFVKNAINSFFLDVQYKKKVISNFSSENPSFGNYRWHRFIVPGTKRRPVTVLMFRSKPQNRHNTVKEEVHSSSS